MADRATWAKRVAAWRTSGLTASKFCEEHDFSVGSLRWWSSRLGTTRRETGRPAIRMARVVRSATCAPIVRVSGSSIMIEVGGARVAVAAGFDRDALTSLLDVLELRGRGSGQ
jgi:hypothetical protein